MAERYKITKKYSENDAVNETMHGLERFIKMDKITPTDKILLTELISSMYLSAFRAGQESVE